jgi:aminoglycoside phosphotransferase (APT) family kinase protein
VHDPLYFGLAPVRDADQLDWPRIDAYVRSHLASFVDAALRDVRQFTNGAANLTYLLRFGDRDLVLRRPPAGTIAPGAHDMKREWRVLSRLWRHFDRAPRAVLFCDDHAVAGADFFVMEHRPGVVIRGEIPAPMAAHRDVARRVSFALIDAMAELHLLDPEAADVGDIGKPTGFVARQVSGWRKRWELAEARSSKDTRGEMAVVGTRLERALPAPQRASIVHNDLKLDNCAFDPANPDRASSIFDWDMTTLGDPLIDLGTLLNYWPDPSDTDDNRPIYNPGMETLGMPTRAEVVDRYATTAAVDVEAVPW